MNFSNNSDINYGLKLWKLQISGKYSQIYLVCTVVLFIWNMLKNIIIWIRFPHKYITNSIHKYCWWVDCVRCSEEFLPTFWFPCWLDLLETLRKNSITQTIQVTVWWTILVGHSAIRVICFTFPQNPSFSGIERRVTGIYFLNAINEEATRR